MSPCIFDLDPSARALRSNVGKWIHSLIQCNALDLSGLGRFFFHHQPKKFFPPVSPPISGERSYV